MDDRRFDALVKAFAVGSNRRRVLKGLLGLGGVAVAGPVLAPRETSAARRTEPTPKPLQCPGRQIASDGVCICPDIAPYQCGPDCCTGTGDDAPAAGHSECCDNACCFGTCYGEELCCPTNDRGTGGSLIPPTHRICESTENGTECCLFDQFCCGADGCCDTACSDDGHCCAPEDVCSGGGESPDLCCVNNLTTSSVCCGGGTNDNACFASVVGICCTDSDCTDPCQVCNPETHLCDARCDLETETCCTDPEGGVQCVAGECCIGGEPGCEDSICCQNEGRNVCLQGDSCGPLVCPCESLLDCCYINEEFAGCVDLTQDGACCTAEACAYFNDFDNCLVGACTDFSCEQRSSCAADEYCCAGSCSPEPCPVTCSAPCGECTECGDLGSCEPIANGTPCDGGVCSDGTCGCLPTSTTDPLVRVPCQTSSECCSGCCGESGINPFDICKQVPSVWQTTCAIYLSAFLTADICISNPLYISSIGSSVELPCVGGD